MRKNGNFARISATICDISHVVLPHASFVFQNRMAAFFPRKASIVVHMHRKEYEDEQKVKTRSENCEETDKKN